LSATNYLGQLIYIMGHPRQALAYFQQAHRFVTDSMEFSYSGIERIGIGSILREMNDLESAAGYINDGLRLAELGGDFTFLRDAYIARARLEQTQKNWATCLEFTAKAEQVAHRSRNVQDGMLLTAWHARFLLARGDVDSAYDWAKQTDVKVDDALTFLREFEHITLARVLVAKGRRNPTTNFLSDAKRLLERLKHSAEEGKRMGRVIEILIQQALAFQVEGSGSKAMTPLEQALKLAEPEGYVRLFIDEGEPMLTLLKQAVARSIAPQYTNKLRAACEAYVNLNSVPETGRSQPWHESISEREKEVLRLIAEGRSSQEIARMLVVALSTVQWHIKNLYAKLDVHSRTQAVKKAKDINLLE
jgi:LuxR family maltose regulon positive regulatory protein